MGVRFVKIKSLFLNNQEDLLYAFIFLLPLQTRWMAKLGELNGGYWEYGTISLYGTDILILGLLLLWFGWKFFGGQMFPQYCGIKFQMSNQTPMSNDQRNTQYIWLTVGLLELFIFISVFFAPDKKLALYGYGRFLLGVGLFFLLTQVELNKIKLYWSIVAAGVIQSCLAIQQFLTQTVISNKWLGMAAQKAQDLGVSVVEAGDERWLRAYGSLPHPNILGGFLAIILLVNIILYFNLRQEKKYQIGLLLSLTFFAINFIGLLLTFSRTAWLGFAAGFIVILLNCSIVSRSKEVLFNISKFIFIIVAIGSLFFYFFRGPILGRLNVNSRLENKSIAERANYNKEARQIIRKHWLFGTGIKNYGLAVYNEIDNSQPAYAYQPVHNVFLLVWAEIGIAGLICFFVFLFFCFLALWRRRSFENLALLISLAVMMCFDHWFWSLAAGGMMMWFVISLSLKDFEIV